MRIHGHSVKVVQICSFSKEKPDIKMGESTGFFCSYKKKLYLVTNSHVLSGKNPFNGDLLKGFAIPGRIEFEFDLIENLENGNKNHVPFKWSINLFGENDEKLWLEHPSEKVCDVVALEINEQLKSNIPQGLEISNIDIEAEIAYPIKIGVMDSVFIIGFPLNDSPRGKPSGYRRFQRCKSLNQSKLRLVNHFISLFFSLFLNVLTYHCFTPISSNRIHIVSACPKLSSQ